MASRSTNVRWQQREITRARRWEMLGARGATVWLTGLPSSGKSTLGAAIERRIVEEGSHAYLLDGDNLRHGICSDLGFSEGDRERNVCRVGDLACLFGDSGAITIVALVSPYASARRLVRERHEREGLAFLEVFVNTPLWMCMERDPKGLYARALTGEIDSFTGIDDPYEAPEDPELELTPEMCLADATDAVLDLLAPHRYSVGASGSGRPRGEGSRPSDATTTADAVVA